MHLAIIESKSNQKIYTISLQRKGLISETLYLLTCTLTAFSKKQRQNVDDYNQDIIKIITNMDTTIS